MPQAWTYAGKYAAWLDYAIVTVPDEVAADQREFDAEGRVFPAIRANGSIVDVRLDGGAYGLHTPGTGDMHVVAATV